MQCYYCTINKQLIIAITAHWIDKHWNLHEALLDFKRLHGSHTGKKLAMEIFDMLDVFNIAEKLFCITTDNASNNKMAMKCLSKLLLKRKGIRWKWEECHISCLNHVIDLAVQAFLKSIKVIETEEEEEVEEEVEEEEDVEDIMEESEDDEWEEEDESVSRSVTQAASEFQAVMRKLHEIVKV